MDNNLSKLISNNIDTNTGQPGGWTLDTQGLEEPPEQKFLRLMASLGAGYSGAKGIGGLLGANAAMPVKAAQQLTGVPGWQFLGNMKNYLNKSPLESVTSLPAKAEGPLVSSQFGSQALMPWISKVLAPRSGASSTEVKAAIDALSALKNDSSHITESMLKAKLMGY